MKIKINLDILIYIVLHRALIAAQQLAVSAVILTLLWISSLTVGRALFFLFTSSSSTRGLMVIPWNQDKTKLKKKKSINVFHEDKREKLLSFKININIMLAPVQRQ